jgi:uncharacterized protein YuzE
MRYSDERKGGSEVRISYYSDTDTLYIDLKEVPGAGTRECMDDLVIDVDSEGKPVGIEIEHASETVDLSHLKTEGLTSTRIIYDPLGSLHNLPASGTIAPEAVAAAPFQMRVTGNGESARIVSELLGQETEELLR